MPTSERYECARETYGWFAKSGWKAMPMSPLSLTSVTLISPTGVTMPLAKSTREIRPPRSVTHIAPSGPHSRSQGVSNPAAIVLTRCAEAVDAFAARAAATVRMKQARAVVNVLVLVPRSAGGFAQKLGARATGRYSEVRRRSPGHAPAPAEETARRAVAGQGGEPQHVFGRLFGAPGRSRAAHVGTHPARIGGVHQHTGAAQALGQEHGERVQRCLGDGVGRCGRPQALLERRRPARDVDDPTVTPLDHPRNEYLGDPPHAQQVGLERLPYRVAIEREKVGALVQENPRVVDEHVHPGNGPFGALDGLLVRNVELHGAGALEPPCHRQRGALVPGSDHDVIALSGEHLTEGQADAPVAASYKGDTAFRDPAAHEHSDGGAARTVTAGTLPRPLAETPADQWPDTGRGPPRRGGSTLGRGPGLPARGPPSRGRLPGPACGLAPPWRAPGRTGQNGERKGARCAR